MINSEQISKLSLRYVDGKNQFDYLDMYYGAESLFEFSRFLRIALHALVNNEVIEKATLSKGFSLELSHSKKSSYIQDIILFAHQQKDNILVGIGGGALYDLLKWSVYNALGKGKEYFDKITNRKAKQAITKLIENNAEVDLELVLEKILRKSLSPVKSQLLNIELSIGRNKEIYTFTEDELNYLETEVIESEIEVVSAMITRFNARTGTGRLALSQDGKSYGFTPENVLSDKKKILLANNLSLYTQGAEISIKVKLQKVLGVNKKLKRYILVDVIE